LFFFLKKKNPNAAFIPLINHCREKERRKISRGGEREGHVELAKCALPPWNIHVLFRFQSHPTWMFMFLPACLSVAELVTSVQAKQEHSPLPSGAASSQSARFFFFFFFLPPLFLVGSNSWIETDKIIEVYIPRC